MEKVKYTNTSDVKNQVIYLKNVEISYTEMSSRAGGKRRVYFSYTPKIETADFGIIQSGMIFRKRINAKHFHYVTGTQISEKTYFANLKKVAKLEKIAKEIEIENRQSEQFEKDCIFSDMVRNFANDLTSAMPKIRQIITKEEIANRLYKDMTTNGICNRAVGLVGYHYAKQFGWTVILKRIYANY
jgi:predicted regulator of amino acid metabolism with ACT domain